MPKFLSREELYRILQRELPEGVYPDGAPSAFFSTAENDSVAALAASGYSSLERIYANFFPQTADERIDDFVQAVFGKKFDATVTLEEKRARVTAKVRKQPAIWAWEIMTLVAGYLPEGTYVQIAPWGCGSAANWKLGVSQLGVNTNLGLDHSFADLGVSADDWCSFVKTRGWQLGVSRLGETTELGSTPYREISDPQMNAFAYDIRIFGYELSGSALTEMLAEVSAAEPARSAHNLRQNLSLSAFGLNTMVSNVDQFSGVDCIARDSASTTGYAGRRA